MTYRIGTLALAGMLTALFSTALPANAAAQQGRSGFSGGIGGGFGSAGISCDDCVGSERQGSGVAYFRLGYTLNPRVVLGAEFNLWSKTVEIFDLDGDATLNLYNFSGTVLFYPRADRGFFLKAGAGASFVDIDINVPGASITADLGRGPGFIVGAGYDIPVTRRLAVTVGANYWRGNHGDLQLFDETFAGKWSQNVVDFTVGITFP